MYVALLTGIVSDCIVEQLKGPRPQYASAQSGTRFGRIPPYQTMPGNADCGNDGLAASGRRAASMVPRGDETGRLFQDRRNGALRQRCTDAEDTPTAGFLIQALQRLPPPPPSICWPTIAMAR